MKYLEKELQDTKEELANAREQADRSVTALQRDHQSFVFLEQACALSLFSIPTSLFLSLALSLSLSLSQFLSSLVRLLNAFLPEQSLCHVLDVCVCACDVCVCVCVCVLSRAMVVVCTGVVFNVWDVSKRTGLLCACVQFVDVEIEANIDLEYCPAILLLYPIVKGRKEEFKMKSVELHPHLLLLRRRHHQLLPHRPLENYLLHPRFFLFSSLCLFVYFLLFRPFSV